MPIAPRPRDASISYLPMFRDSLLTFAIMVTAFSADIDSVFGLVGAGLGAGLGGGGDALAGTVDSLI
jgi:hypothetical protein